MSWAGTNSVLLWVLWNISTLCTLKAQRRWLTDSIPLTISTFCWKTTANLWQLMSLACTGCIEGFFKTENGKENGIKGTKSISIFCIWKSVKKVKCFWEQWMAWQEKFNFLYTFSDTEIANRFCTFYTIFFTIFCSKKSFYVPCVGWWYPMPPQKGLFHNSWTCCTIPLDHNDIIL